MTTYKYLWKIPNLTNNQKDLICGGYARKIYDKYVISPIIKLISYYYSTDEFTIDDIKNAKPSEIFYSPIFSINNIDWYLELHPNDRKIVNIYLYLAMLPTQTISNISTKLKLTLLETNTCEEIKYEFNTINKHCSCWKHNILSLSQLQNLNQFTFVLTKKIITIKYETGQQICNDSPYNELILIKPITYPKYSYKWCIKNTNKMNDIKQADIGDYFDGELMCTGPFKWCFKFCPFYNTKTSAWFGIVLFYWPPKYSKALIKWTLSFTELNISYTAYKAFDVKQTWFGCIGNSSEKQLIEMNQYTLKAEVSIIKMLDKNDNIVPYDHTLNIKLQKEYNNICLPIIKYEWKISDKNMMEQIKNTVNVSGFISPIFEMYGIKWYFELWPNGSRLTRAGDVNVFINMVTFECVNMEVIALVNILWVQCNDRYSNNDTFNVALMTDGATNWKLKTKDLKNLKEITFNLEVSILDIIINNEIVTQKYIENNKDYELKLIHSNERIFEWKIDKMVLNEMKSIENKEMFESEIFTMFGMEWKLMFYPNGRENVEDSMSLDLGFGVKLMKDSLVMTVRFTFEILETKTRYVGCTALHEANKDVFWGSDRISMDTFKKLEQCNIVLRLELIDVYDNQKKVTHMFDGRDTM
eukprot:244504_1